MSMKKSQRIKTVVEIKAAKEKNALEALGVVQKKRSTMQAQVEGLKNYRQEYQDKFDQLGSGGVNVAQFMEFRAFIEKLDKAITGQENLLNSLEADLMVKRKNWEQRHHETRSLQKICYSALEAEMQQESKREQIEQDERASRGNRSNVSE